MTTELLNIALAIASLEGGASHDPVGALRVRDSLTIETGIVRLNNLSGRS
jgi:hypothetical protein